MTEGYVLVFFFFLLFPIWHSFLFADAKKENGGGENPNACSDLLLPHFPPPVFPKKTDRPKRFGPPAHNKNSKRYLSICPKHTFRSLWSLPGEKIRGPFSSTGPPPILLLRFLPNRDNEKIAPPAPPSSPPFSLPPGETQRCFKVVDAQAPNQTPLPAKKNQKNGGVEARCSVFPFSRFPASRFPASVILKTHPPHKTF